MSGAFGPYLAADRLRAIALGEDVPYEQQGAALFADVCGFTAHGEQRLAEFGEQEGAERVAAELSRIHDVIFPVVHDHGGSVVGFNGDAVTCWFPLDDGRAAVRAAHTLQARLSGRPQGLPVKVAIAAGRTRRFAVGLPEVQRLDVLAGATMDRMAAAERNAAEGEVVVSVEVLSAAGIDAPVRETRAGGAFVALSALGERSPLAPRTDVPPSSIDSERARPWLLPAVHERLAAGHGDFLAEIRRVTAIFVGFEGLDYDHDAEVGDKLDAFVCSAQRILVRRGGHLIKLTTGDKGSHLLGIFGAPVARDDGTRQALSAAMEIQGLRTSLEFIRGIRVGVSHGRMLTGAFGTRARRAYDVLGTEANIAARLMQIASSGETLVTPRVRRGCPDFDFDERGPVVLKGRTVPLEVAAVTGRSAARAPERTDAVLGRDPERGRIEAQLRAFAASGRGSVVVLEGEPGIGKTRLAEDLRVQAVRLGLAVLSGGGDSIEQHTPYLALRGPFASVLGAASSDAGAAASRVESLLGGPADLDLMPLLASIVGLELPESPRTSRMVGPARADSTADLLARLLAGVARSERVVLLVEDAHWLDSASWAVLLHVRRTVPNVLVVVTTRPPPRNDADGRWGAFAQLARGEDVEYLSLAPLAPDHALALACRRLGITSLPPSIARLIAETAGGHPLFSQELAVALRERGTLTIDGGQCKLSADAAALRVGDLFDNVEEAITSRVDGLAPGEQLALKIASVIGREFSAAAVSRAHPLGADQARVPELLEAAARLGITEWRPGGEGGKYAFRHAITQEVVYGLLPGEQRRDLHRAVGELLEAGTSTDRARSIPLLAHHFSRAEMPHKAVGYLEQAGEQARRVHANREVVRFLGEALELDHRAGLATSVPRARWRRQIGEALLDLGRLTEGREQLRQSAEILALPAATTRTALALSLSRGVGRQILHRNLPARFLSRDAGRAGELLEAARVQLGLTKAAFYLNDGPKMVDAALHAMNLAERVGTSPELALAYSANAIVAGAVPLRRLAETYGRLARETAERAGDRAAEARVLHTVAVYDVGIGRWDLARGRARRARELFEQLGDRRQWEETLAVEAPPTLHMGAIREADELVDRLHASARLREDPHTLSWGLLGQIEVRLREQGTARLAEALEKVKEVESLFDAKLGPMEEARALGLGALTRLGLGDAPGAAASADAAYALVAAQRPASPHTLDGQASVASTYLGLWALEGARGRARFAPRARAACAALSGYARVFPIARPRALLCEGLYHRLEGRRTRAARSLERARTAAATLGMPYEAALVRRELAHAVD